MPSAQKRDSTKALRRRRWRCTLHILIYLTTALICFTADTLHAQTTPEPFPRRPIRIIVYTGPGGLIDFTARKFAEVARKYDSSQPIVIINKPGAGGIVAFDEVLQQPADGYNVLAVTRSNITKIVSANREDLIDAVDWIAYLMDNPHVVITNTDSGLDTWDGLQQHSQKNAGRQLWLGADIGGVKHISAINVWERTGIKARWIPYASGGQAVSALLGEIGHVYFGNPADATGKPQLKIVAVCAAERMSAFPEAPTFTELGIPGLEHENIWRGLALKKGTPQHILDWFDDICRKVTDDPEWRDTWRSEGITLTYKPTAEFTKIVEADRAEFRTRLIQLGLIKQRNEEKLFGVIHPESAVSLTNLLLITIFFVSLILVVRSPYKHHFGEVAISAAAAILACILLVMSFLLPQPNEVDRVGASGVPRLWSVALLLLAAMQVVILLGRKIGGVKLEENIATASTSQGLLFVPFVLLFAAYLGAVVFFGYILSTLIFLPLAMWLIRYRKFVTISLITLCWLAFAYFVFEKTLFVDLPRGIFAGFFQ